MGNAVFMSMLAMRPEYNDKVQMFVGIAPYSKVRMDFSRFPRFEWLLGTMVGWLKHTKNTKKTDIFRRRKINALVGVCWSLPRVCHKAIPLNLDWKLLPVMVGYFPSGTSNKNAKHLFQLRNGQFRQYDFGQRGNLEHYGNVVPPEYDLSKVRVPVSLYYGEVDPIVSVKGMKAQVKALPNVVKAVIVPKYNHISFLVDRDTRDAVNIPIIQDLRRFAT
uniref:Lipase 1 n=2 Tax=Cacopsylla melanoneura TaxID=428564 RepID=A0A8D8LKW5_9HEMI